MRFGDRIRIEVKGRDGHSVFGAIDQRVAGPGGAGAGSRVAADAGAQSTPDPAVDGDAT